MIIITTIILLCLLFSLTWKGTANNEMFPVSWQHFFSVFVMQKKKRQKTFKVFYVFRSLSRRLLCFDFLVFATGRLLGWTLLWSTERGSSCYCAFVCRCLGVNTDSGGPLRLFSGLVSKHIQPFSRAAKWTEPVVLLPLQGYSEMLYSLQNSVAGWRCDSQPHQLTYFCIYFFMSSSCIL